MRHLSFGLFALLTAATAWAADDVTTSISVSIFECQTPKSDPMCIAFDEASKPKSCPGCTAWKKVTVDSDVSAKTRPEYSQPSAFADDLAKQLYGEGLPRNADGKPVSIKELYENHAKYGWVTVPDGQHKEGTIALLPNTAGVVVDEKGDGQINVIYSSTKRGGEVRETDLDNLIRGQAEPKFVLPSSFIEKAAEAAPPPSR